jgi:hypothetical protein
MSVIPSKAGPTAMPGAQRVTLRSTPPMLRWGAFLAVLGIVLVALNLCAAVVSVPPIFDRIDQSFPISPTAQGIMGMLPDLSFALFGALAPRLTRRSRERSGHRDGNGVRGRIDPRVPRVTRSSVSAGWLSVMCCCHPRSNIISRIGLVL